MPSPISFSTISAAAWIWSNQNAPQFTIQNLYEVVDNVSIVKGKHSLKFGAEYRWYISPQNFTQRSRGDYEYNSSQVYLEDLAPTILANVARDQPPTMEIKNAIYWYANDIWRVNQHSSLNAGIRYEYTTTSQGERLTDSQLSCERA